jgi:hypothetical protein
MLRLDPDIGPVKTDRLDLCITEAEQVVDAELALRCTLPITVSTHPEWFAVAKNVTVRLAASDFLKDMGQREDDEKRLWQADNLKRDAMDWLKRLRTPLSPTNVPDGVSPYVNSPTDGGGVARVSVAKVQSSMVTLGNSKHW